MRLLSWNIQWCRGMDGVVDPLRIAREARRLADPDVLCLQEVAENFRALSGSRGEDQAELLAQAFPGYAAAYAWGVDVPDGAGGRRRFGNLILSRLPLLQVLRHSLPWPALSGAPSMPRVALEALIEGPFGPLRVTTTHLEKSLGRRAPQGAGRAAARAARGSLRPRPHRGRTAGRRRTVPRLPRAGCRDPVRRFQPAAGRSPARAAARGLRRRRAAPARCLAIGASARGAPAELPPARPGARGNALLLRLRAGERGPRAARACPFD